MRINPDDYKPHEIWQMVMIGKPIKRYPNGYFSGAPCNEKFREIFQYICLQHYQWELEEVPQHINSYFLKDNKLASLYNSLFHNNAQGSYHIYVRRGIVHKAKYLGFIQYILCFSLNI